MNNKKINRIGYITAGLTFLIASVILIAHYYGLEGMWEYYGIMLIPIAFCVNLIVILVMSFIANYKNVKGPFRSILVMFLNIPVAIIYLWLAICLSSYFRVTIINDTSSAITNVKLFGCDDKTVGKLNSGEEITFWVEINRDCSIRISYLDNSNQDREDVVIGYLSGAMGSLDNYHISGKNNPRY